MGMATSPSTRQPAGRGLCWSADRHALRGVAMPQGGIDVGEDPRSTAFRELKEEIGTDKAEILAERADWLRYELPIELVEKARHGPWRGQLQKCFSCGSRGPTVTSIWQQSIPNSAHGSGYRSRRCRDSSCLST